MHITMLADDGSGTDEQGRNSIGFNVTLIMSSQSFARPEILSRSRQQQPSNPHALPFFNG